MYAQRTFHLRSHRNNGRVHIVIRRDELYLQLEAEVDLKFLFFLHSHIKRAVFGCVFMYRFLRQAQNTLLLSKQASLHSAYGRRTNNRTTQGWALTSKVSS